MRRQLHLQSRTALERESTKVDAHRQVVGATGSRQRWLIRLGELFLFLVVAAAVLWPAPIHSHELPAAFAESDIMISHWPSALLIKRTIAQEHRLPLWNPYYGGGRPLAADPLAAMFYPASWLVNLLPIRDYYLALLIGHLMLAGVGTLLLARRAFGLTRWPSLVAAVSYMATPRLIGHLGAGHVTLVQTVAWYPWLALGAWATVRQPRRWAAPFALVLGLMLLAGHPQMAYYGALMTSAITLWLLWGRYRSADLRALRASVIGLAAAGAVGVMLAAVHLLPLAQFTGLSTRQDSVAATDKYPLVDFLRALVGHPPASSVPWENIIQPGWMVLMLAILGALAAGRRVLPLAAGIVLVAALAMGNASPIFFVAAHTLPDFTLFHGLSRIWFLGLLGFAILAAFGTEALIGLVQGNDPEIVRQCRLAVGVFILLVVATTLVKSDQGLAQVGSVTPSTTPTQLEQTVTGMAGGSRIYGVQRNLDQISAVTLNTRFADGWDPLLIESYVRFMQLAGGYTFHGYQLTIPPVDNGYPNARMLGLMNVGIVVSRADIADPNLILVKTIGRTNVYRNKLDAGPAYLVRPAADGAPPDLQQLVRLPGGVKPVRLSREEDRFTVTTSAPAYLVVANPVYPGWTATFDGRAVPVRTIDGYLPAIRVDAGTHTLVYRFAPRTVYAGAAISLTGLLLLLVGLYAGWYRQGDRWWRRRKARAALDPDAYAQTSFEPERSP